MSWRIFHFSEMMFLFMILLVLEVYSELSFLNQVQIHNGLITSIDFYPDYSKAITSSSDGSFAIWSTSTMEIIGFKNLTTSINAVGLNPQNNDIIVLLQNGNVQIYESSTLTLKNSFTYPNSGHGNAIQFISKGNVYVLGGYDLNSAPKMHYFDSNHNLIRSASTGFNVNSSIDRIFNAADAMIFVSSDEATAPVTIQMYVYANGQYSVAKKFSESNAKVKDMSISLDGANFYSVAEDLTVRNYSISPFNQMYEINNVFYLQQNPTAVNGLASAVFYIATPTQMWEYLKMGEISHQTSTPLTSQVNRIINLFPSLLCTTVDGKVIVYQISFFDGIDHDVTKWIVLSSIMGSIVLILLVGMAFEMWYLKKKSGQYIEESQQTDSKKVQQSNIDQLP